MAAELTNCFFTAEEFPVQERGIATSLPSIISVVNDLLVAHVWHIGR